MTLPGPATIERDTLYVTDAELIRRLGVPENIAYATLRELDRDPGNGFPQKQKIWGGRRYWPAVRAYLDRTSGLTIGTSLPPQRGSR